MAPSRLQFDMGFSLAPAAARRRAPARVLRLLVLADLGGDRSVPLAARKPLALDIDRFDAVFARIAPRVQLQLDGQALALQFQALDDLHPDALYRQVPAFDALRRLRDEAADPRQLPRVAAQLGVGPASAPAAAAPSEAPAAADAGDDIFRLLGKSASPAPAPAAAAPSPAADVLQGWLRTLVSPHVQPGAPAQQAPVQAALDAATTALMRELLHAAPLQALEASWRGLERLVRGLELGETVQLAVLDVSRAELQDDISRHAADLSASALHTHFNPADGADAQRHGLFVVDQAFGPADGDVQLLATLGALAARAGAPLVAGASPALAGAARLADLAEPRRWAAEQGDEASEALAAWAALRSAPMAPWIGLALPRVLLRLPYGAATDRISSFAFDEMPAGAAAEARHGAYLWGNGALALALLAGLARQQGDDDSWSLTDALDLDDLPSHIVTGADGEREQQPVAELLLGEAAGQALLERGLMPLLSHRQRNAARLMRWQSVAHPPQALQGLDG